MNGEQYTMLKIIYEDNFRLRLEILEDLN